MPELSGVRFSDGNTFSLAGKWEFTTSGLKDAFKTYRTNAPLTIPLFDTLLTSFRTIAEGLPQIEPPGRR